MAFITFEGIDGCGKTTQANLLCEKLKSKSIDFEYIREPGGTKISEEIRKILLNPDHVTISNVSETLLFLASRSQIVIEKIKPALLMNKWVICDRYIDSTIAYQGYGRQLNVSLLNKLNEFATDLCLPDLTIFLDINVSLAQNRLSLKKRDRFENENIEFYNRVRKGFLKIKENNNRIKLIDSSKSIENISIEIWDKIKKTEFFNS